MSDKDPVGVQLTAEGADAFQRSIADANKAVESLSKSLTNLEKSGGDLKGTSKGLDDVEKAAKGATAGLGDTLNALSRLPIIGSSIGQLASTFNGVQVAGEAAGAASASAFGPVVIALGAVMAAAAAVVGVFAGINASVQGLANYAGAINDIQKVTGASAAMSQQINASARIAGVSTDLVTMSFLQLNDGATSASEAAAKGLAKVGGAADQTAKQLERLNTDHAARLADIAKTSADQIEQLQQQAADRSEAYQQARAEREATYNDQIEAGRAALADRLSQLEEQHAQRVSDLQSSLADELAGYEQDRQARADKLNESLANAEADYTDKREAINKKYFAPKSAREQLAKEEELKALDAQYKAEQDKLKAKAAKEEAQAKAASDKKVATIQAQLAKENAEYAKQTARLNAENAKREAELKKSLDKQNATAQAAYDKQVAQAAAAQLKIQAETQKRLDAEALQYQRSLEDMQSKTAGAAGGVAAAVSPVEGAFKKLGISLEEWNSLSPDDKVKRFSDALKALPDDATRLSVLSDVFGRRRAAEMLEFFEVYQKPTRLGLELTPQELADLEQFQRDQRNMQLQFDLLGMEIGKVFFPIWQDLLNTLKAFWAEHGPAITQAVSDIANWFKGTLTTAVGGMVTLWDTGLKPAIEAVWKFINDNLLPIFRSVADFLKTVFTVVIGAAILSFDNWLKSMKPVWDFFDKNILPILKSVADFITKSVSTAIQGVIDKFADLGGAIGRFFEGLKPILDRVIAGFPDWLKKLLGIDNAAQMNNLGIKVTYTGEGNAAPWMTQLPGYATGGMMPAGQPAMVGEAGPEWLIPQTNTLAVPIRPPASAGQIFNQYGGGTTTTTTVNVGGINISGGNYATGQQAARGLIDTLRARGVTIVGAN